MVDFVEFLNSHDFLMADGATGTNLFNMGLESGDSPELWNEDEPDKIRALYRGAVEAGSDLFLTNSFGANRARLKLHDAGHRAYDLSKRAAELGREVADAAGRTVIVAGSVGPTGEIMEPTGSLSHAEAVDIFEETARGLKDGGADILWLETISAPEEYRAAAEAFARVDMPWVGTMSFDTAGRTMMGVTSPALVELVKGLDNPPVAFGANCGVGASDLLRTVLGFNEAYPNIPIVAKGNAGIPKYVDGEIHYNGTPELMAEYAVLARAAGAKIIGGCCGTTPAHLEKMREALDTQEVGPRPSLEAISSALGAFSSDSDGTDAATCAPQRERRGRRRAKAEG
ncbi:Bifunctional homocysteine S-methyltransferase/5,10-methylenetetrahydrofolate reductase [Tritonibacter multivorans]|uniref:Bifunctional homocysteine S-methyltransferase/5,10-methylenetetrahydrofolate reductase n=1 Tax=Tritonibacter multivorans TaxID=928856 RepID=A0A0P1G1A5_9RHOB|nr:betaine--homocysteine S-methyltransferase [Tritonibacter multivorans]MDA7419359.1 betaine--homocysteine S-methyltransferase [Tritonibacter multivorans]CUH75304.1 Bifunctional homocysteine S-methyltransferase/5,10-methylenetetrahydrofolate reductase [Tritonibacter multivorans]SFD21389.1 5-methyltetrahydrofolate--homocysteine methyltransferase [Tritonibacter multivorans]